MIEVLSTAAERGKRDLFFLASGILGTVYPDLTEKTHKPICDFFVKKDPERPFGRQDNIKNRLLLDPRGHYKTSIDLCDAIQWMLCFPDVTMAVLSGSEELAERMIDELKQIFLTCSDFRAVYPEYCPKEGQRWGTAGTFVIPNRSRIRKEPTVTITTIDKAKASSHYDIRKGDDVVNEINSQKPEQCQKIIRQWKLSKSLLNPGGYSDLIGTRYDFSDLYGDTLDRAIGPDWEGGELVTTSRGWKIFIRPAWVENDKGEKVILFPEKFCVDANDDPEKFNLEEYQRDEPDLFNAQYMNYPIGTETHHFPLKLIAEHVIPRERIPGDINLFMLWDLAYTTKKTSDFSVGAVVGFDRLGNRYLVDLFRGRWTPYQIIDMLIFGFRKWPIQRVGIEDSIGTQFLRPGIEMKQAQLKINIPIDWIKIPRGKDAVKNEIESMEPLLTSHRLWFNEQLPQLQDLYLEFSRFPKYKHDDIPRAVSLSNFYRAAAYNNIPVDSGCEIVGAQTYGDGECGAGIVA